MLLGMLASSVARGVIDRRRRRMPGERPVIPHISPDPPGRALALGQDTDGGVVAMKALGSQHMTFDQVEERHDGEGPVAAWSASVDNGRSIRSHLKRALWRLSGICMPNLSNRIVASNCGPMKPRGVAWNGAGEPGSRGGRRRLPPAIRRHPTNHQFKLHSIANGNISSRQQKAPDAAGASVAGEMKISISG